MRKWDCWSWQLSWTSSLGFVRAGYSAISCLGSFRISHSKLGFMRLIFYPIFIPCKCALYSGIIQFFVHYNVIRYWSPLFPCILSYNFFYIWILLNSNQFLCQFSPDAWEQISFQALRSFGYLALSPFSAFRWSPTRLNTSLLTPGSGKSSRFLAILIVNANN